MTEPTDALLTEQDKIDLESLGETDAITHTVIELWQKHLAPADKIRDTEKIAPGFAAKIVSTWPKISVQEVKQYHEGFHNKIIELRGVLNDEVEAWLAEYPDALEHVEDDRTFNRQFYINVLAAWQERIQDWEYRDFEVTAPDAHIQIALIADVTAFFIGSTGIAQHLDSIGFAYDADAQGQIRERLEKHLEELNA